MTSNGVEFEVTEDGCLVIHHGETVKSCARGRKGVAIILSPQVRKAWDLGGSRFCSDSGGRTLSIEIPLAGQRTWVSGLWVCTSQHGVVRDSSSLLRRSVN